MPRRRHDLGDRIALVTGASSGIGADFARSLAERGVGEVVLVARRRERLEQLAAEIGPRARIFPADLTRPEQVMALIQSEPRVDVLVNNAGFGWASNLEDQVVSGGAPRVIDMIELNCRALVDLTMAWLPGMVERHAGWVLNVGSIAGLVPTPGFAVYGATKAFVHSFTEALRLEVRGERVRVHLLAPGPVMSEFFEVAHPGATRPPAFAFLKSRRVADEALDALLGDRARLIPGAHVRAGATLASALPLFLFRPLARAAVSIRRKG